MTISTVQVGQGSRLTLTLYSDGDETDLGTVTVGIEDANGDTVVSSGTSVTDNSDGTYEYSLAKQTEPGFHINTWSVAGGSDFTTYTDVQGSTLFNEASLRAFDDEAVSNATLYDDDAIGKMHQRVVEYLEAYTGRGWVRRYNRVTVNGTGSRLLDLSHMSKAVTSGGLHLNRPGAYEDIIQIISADDGETVSTSNIEIHPGGVLQRTDAAWTAATTDSPFNVTIEYEYGQPYPVDGADRIAMMLAKHWLVTTRIPDTATAFNDALGSFSFDETRLPYEVFTWLRNHKIRGYF